MRPLLRPHIATLIIRLYQITRVPSASLREPRDVRIDTPCETRPWDLSSRKRQCFSRSLLCFCFCHSYFSEKLAKYLCMLKVGLILMRGILILTLHRQFESFLASTKFRARTFTMPTKDCCHLTQKLIVQRSKVSHKCSIIFLDFLKILKRNSSRTQLKDLARGLLHSLNIITKSTIFPLCIVYVLWIVAPSKLSQTHKRPRYSHNFLQMYSTISQKL